MPEIFSCEKLISSAAKRKFGRFCRLGTIQLGQTNFGDDDIYFAPCELGNFALGQDILGSVTVYSGIYRTDNVSGYTRHYREPYYITKNPRSIPQQSTRTNFAGAVAAWQALTSEEKQVYNSRTIGKSLSGYNLFLREYLFSH